jgi:hypothetical protein
MIQSLRAMTWLRWRLLLNTLRGGRRRDTMERVSRVMALMVPIILAALFVGSTVAMIVFGYVGGRAIATGLFATGSVVLVARIALGILFIVLVILAIGSPGQTTLAKYTRLLILPIPRQALHLVEVLANLGDPWQVLIGAGMFSFAAGLALHGRPIVAGVALVAALLMMAVLAALSALLGFIIAWLFRSRRRGEMFTLVFVMALSVLSLIPALMGKSIEDRHREEERTGVKRPFSVEDFDRALPAYSRLVPSETYGWAINEAAASRTGGVGLALATLAAQAALLFAASSAVHRRVIQSLEGDHRKRKSRDVLVRAPRLPFVGAAASAVAWAQFRTAVRSVRGRLIVLLPGPLLAMLTLLFREMPDEGPWAVAAAEQGHLLLGAGVIFCFYSLLAFTMNMFGSDRSGLTLQLLQPIRDRDLAWGKVAGCAMILGASVSVTLVASVAVATTGSPYYWMAVLVGGLSMYLALSPIAVSLSALFPTASDLSKTGSGGNPHPLPMFAGTFLVMLAAAPPAIIVVLGEYWWKQPAMALGAMFVWTAIVTAAAVPLVNLAARTIGARRENLSLIAQSK